MRCLQPLGHLNRDVEGLVQLPRPGFDLLAQRLAFDEGHRDESFAFRFADLVDLANVGVIESRGGFSFSPETRLDFFLAEQVAGEKF